MASLKTKLVVKNVFKQIHKKVQKGAKEGFDTVALDLKETSSRGAPFKTGHLEANHMDIEYGVGSWKALIYFVAFNEDFDYGLEMHEGTYNLGPKSRTKQGGNSKFAGSVPVGRKYAERTVEQGRDNYQQYIADKIIEGLGD